MAQRLYDEDSVKNIANAIRAKNGSTETYNIDEMPTAIEKLSGASFEIDSELSSNSENPVQNKVIKAALDKKQGIIQYSVMPEAGQAYENKIVQYVGKTTSPYTLGYFYQCRGSSSTYRWYPVVVSKDFNKMDIPNTTSIKPLLVTYSLIDGTGIKYIDTSISSGSTDVGIPTSKAVSQYVQNSVSNKVDKVEGKGLSTNDYTNEDKAEIAKIAEKADISNPLSLSDTNLQINGLIAQSYTPAGSTPGTVGTTTYSVVTRDTATLDDSISGAGKIPSSYAVGEYVKNAINSAITTALNTEV